jgi:hypothetical protein
MPPNDRLTVEHTRIYESVTPWYRVEAPHPEALGESPSYRSCGRRPVSLRHGRPRLRQLQFHLHERPRLAQRRYHCLNVLQPPRWPSWTRGELTVRWGARGCGSVLGHRLLGAPGLVTETSSLASSLDLPGARLALSSAVAQAYINLYRDGTLADVAQRAEVQVPPASKLGRTSPRSCASSLGISCSAG